MLQYNKPLINATSKSMNESESPKVVALQRVTLFNTFAVPQIQNVATLLKEQTYRKHQIIFHQGDPGGHLYLIVEGRVRIYLNHPDGQEITLRIYGAGASFGELSVLDGAPRSASAAALTDVIVYVLYRDDFLPLLQYDFTITRSLLTILTERLRYTTMYSERLAFLTVPGRVAAMLVQLASAESDASETVRLELTQQHLAQLTSTTREWVNRALRDFAAQGFIEIERGAVIIRDRPGLQTCVK